MRARTTGRWISMIAVLAMVMAACSGDTAVDPTDAGADEPAATEATTDDPATTEGTSEAPADEPAALEGRAGTLVVDIPSGTTFTEGANFNPYLSAADIGISQVLSEPLFNMNTEAGGLEPWLAESVEPNDDFTQWTLTLKEGITWSDGEAMTADDVVFTVDMLKSVEVYANAELLADVTATATDDLTVTFDLAETNPRFAINTFANHLGSGTVFVVPEHVWGAVDDLETYTNEDPVFTGPYEVSAVEPNRISYTRRADYWGADTFGMPAPTQVDFVAFDGEEQKVAALTQGDLDWAADISTGTYAAASAGNDLIGAYSTDAPFGYVDLCPRSFEFNQLYEPFQDANVRHGIAHLLDREKALDVGYDGFGVPTTNMFLPAYDGLQPYIEAAGDWVPAFDSNLAAERFEAAGYTNDGGQWTKDGEPLSFSITHFGDPIIGGMVKVFVEDLIAAGIDASENAVDGPGPFVEGLKAGTFEAQAFFGACGSSVDVWKSMDALSNRHINDDGTVNHHFQNTMRWNNQAYSDIVAKMLTTNPDDDAMMTLFGDAMEYVKDELPLVPIAQHPIIHPTSSQYWTGWPTTDDPYVQPLIPAGTFSKVLHNLEPAG